MYFDDGARTTRGMEARLLSSQNTHTLNIYIRRKQKERQKKGKRDNQDHKGMTQECMTQECVHDVKRRTKREKRIMADGHDRFSLNPLKRFDRWKKLPNEFKCRKKQ